MRPILDEAELRSALRAADAFWRALGRDDDAALAAVLEPEALASLGAGPGLGERIRGHLDISTAMCTCLGVVSPVSLGEGRRMRATYALTSVPLSVGQDVQDGAWCLEISYIGGTSQIDPTASHHVREVAHRWVSLDVTWPRIIEAR